MSDQRVGLGDRAEAEIVRGNGGFLFASSDKTPNLYEWVVDQHNEIERLKSVVDVRNREIDGLRTQLYRSRYDTDRIAALRVHLEHKGAPRQIGETTYTLEGQIDMALGNYEARIRALEEHVTHLTHKMQRLKETLEE